jgi:hypothetical protein
MTPLRQRLIDDLRLRNYSPRTIEAYVGALAQFARYFGRSPEVLGPEEIRLYQLHLLGKQASWSRFNQAVSALRLLYRLTLGRPEVIPMIPYGKKPRRLPAVLSREEVLRLLAALPGGRLRTLVRTAYACGLRIASNSCRNRHCPKCQGAARAARAAREMDLLLPVEYHHVVFTLPEALGPLALQNPRVLYGLLFQAAWQTVRELTADPHYLGAEVGMVAVLHQVKSVRDARYVFMQKSKFPLRPDRLLALVLLEEEQQPDVYLIPATAWKSPNGLLVGRDYEGLKRKPEWGIQLSACNRSLLDPYHFDSVIGFLCGGPPDPMLQPTAYT